MKKYIFILLAFFFSAHELWAIDQGDLTLGTPPEGSIVISDPSLIGILSIIQGILLRGVFPIIVVGSALYIAYQLLTAEGDEARMKQAWRSLGYTAIALLVVALSYALISILSNLSL